MAGSLRVTMETKGASRWFTNGLGGHRMGSVTSVDGTREKLYLGSGR